jgi:hypothetical protein
MIAPTDLLVIFNLVDTSLADVVSSRECTSCPRASGDEIGRTQAARTTLKV